MIIRVIELSVLLAGPFSFVLLAGLYLGRRVYPEMQLLYEVPEPIVIIAAAIIAFAVAGLIVPVLNSSGG